jgi:hypothetical protein
MGDFIQSFVGSLLILNNPSYGHPWTILKTFKNIVTSFSSLTTFYPYNNTSFLS